MLACLLTSRQKNEKKVYYIGVSSFLCQLEKYLFIINLLWIIVFTHNSNVIRFTLLSSITFLFYYAYKKLESNQFCSMDVQRTTATPHSLGRSYSNIKSFQSKPFESFLSESFFQYHFF